jgi:hypothetical protein
MKISLTRLPVARDKRKPVLRETYLSEAFVKGSKGALVRDRKTNARFQFSKIWTHLGFSLEKLAKRSVRSLSNPRSLPECFKVPAMAVMYPLMVVGSKPSSNNESKNSAIIGTVAETGSTFR